MSVRVRYAYLKDRSVEFWLPILWLVAREPVCPCSRGPVGPWTVGPWQVRGILAPDLVARGPWARGPVGTWACGPVGPWARP